MAANEDPIRLGLIGTGLAIELLHWPALRHLRDRFTVTAFADRSRGQGEHFAAYSGVDPSRYHSDHRALLDRDDVDAVLVTVPIAELYAIAADALAAGKHVLCEKPTGADEEQALAFLALVDRYPDRTIMVGENYFYRDDLRHARALVDAGAIGQPHLMSWRRAGRLVPNSGTFTSTPWRYRAHHRGGVQLDVGVHDVAQIRMLCGEVARVHGAAHRANSTIDSPSDLTLNLVFTSGAIGNYTAAYTEIPVPPEPNEMRVYGSEGVLVLGGTLEERYVTVSDRDGATGTDVFRGHDNGYLAELSDFADALRYGDPVVGTVEQSVANMLVVLRALDSAELGEALAVDHPAGEVPLWRPRGAAGLFDGLPGERLGHRLAVTVDTP